MASPSTASASTGPTSLKRRDSAISFQSAPPSPGPTPSTQASQYSRPTGAAGTTATTNSQGGSAPPSAHTAPSTTLPSSTSMPEPPSIPDDFIGALKGAGYVQLTAGAEPQRQYRERAARYLEEAKAKEEEKEMQRKESEAQRLKGQLKPEFIKVEKPDDKLLKELDQSSTGGGEDPAQPATASTAASASSDDASVASKASSVSQVVQKFTQKVRKLKHLVTGKPIPEPAQRNSSPVVDGSVSPITKSTVQAEKEQPEKQGFLQRFFRWLTGADAGIGMRE